MQRDIMNETYNELRAMLLNGNLNPDYMTEAKYEYLYKNEISRSDEFDLGNPADEGLIEHLTVLDFCTKGLRTFEKYKGLSDIQLFLAFNHRKAEIEEAEREVMTSFRRHPLRQNKLAMFFLAPIAVVMMIARHPKMMLKTAGALFKKFYRSHKLAVVTGALVLTFALGVSVTASALGYSVLDLIKSALNSPDKTATGDDGKVMVFTENTRFYNSFSEMIEAENIRILYPAKLPYGYEFTEFRVDEFDDYFEVKAHNEEPYVSIHILVDVKYDIDDDYLNETNGIRYNIVETDDGFYQADWSDGTDYYTIVVGDKNILSEIIENLEESN